MQASRGFVENVEHTACALAQCQREAHPLMFATRQRGKWLSQCEIPETDTNQWRETRDDARLVCEDLNRFVNRKGEHFGNRPSRVWHFQNFAAIAGPVAFVAGDSNVVQELHVNHDFAAALAGVTTSARDVE